MSAHVEIRDLYFRYKQDIDEKPVYIFDGVNIQIPEGKITTIMGPSGSGKTTLLRLIGGQFQPTQGEVLVKGQNINQLKRHELFLLRKKMGMLFQNGGLFTHLNVFENVAYPLREHTKLSEQLIRNLVLMKLEMVGLRGVRNYMPHELSGGMGRRIALARAIALDPKLLMYDEPLTGQDPITKGVLVKLIRNLNDILGLTSIIVSHDVRETLPISDYVYVISGGKVIGHGTRDQMVKDTSPSVQQFLNGLADGPVPFHHAAPTIEQDFFKE